MKTLMAAAFWAAFAVWQPDNGEDIRDRLDKYLLAYEPQLSTNFRRFQTSARIVPPAGQR